MASLKSRQFRALLKKNVLIQARSRKTIFGIGGWGALLLQVLLPPLCFLIMYVPKYYIKPIRFNTARDMALDLDSRLWSTSDAYSGPAMQQVNSSTAHLVLAPDTPAVQALAQVLARALACPLNPDKRSCSLIPALSDFYCMFINARAPPQCAEPDTCMADPACWGHLLTRVDRTWYTRPPSKFTAGEDVRSAQTSFIAPITIAADETAALNIAMQRPARIDAVLVFPDALQPDASTQPSSSLRSAAAGAQPSTDGPQLSQQLLTYSIRMNHSSLPDTKFLLDNFDAYISENNGLSMYKQYWFFANLEHTANRAILGMRSEELQSLNSTTSRLASTGITPSGNSTSGVAGQSSQLVTSAATSYSDVKPAPLRVSVKSFPWPAVDIDAGAAAAAVFVNLLMAIAFLPAFRAVIGGIVREKELRLREGMKLMGLSDTAYWSSWFLTHWAVLLPAGLLCAFVGSLPFARTSITLQCVFFTLFTASLVFFSYFVSTVFGTSQVAGAVGQLLYVLAMTPGFVVPYVAPYAGATWYAACLLPPSAIALWATCITNWELISQGLTWRTAQLPVSVGSSFCAASVLMMLAVDILLFALLAWYLDKVLPTSPSRPRPPLFFLEYFKSSKTAAHAAPGLPSPDKLQQQPPHKQQAAFAALDIAQHDAGSSRGTTAAPAPARQGIVVDRLVKVFPGLGMSKVTALDGARLEARPRGITALLGHNGAGKTTLISILTGLETADSGNAYVNGLDVASHMEDIRHDLGVCPQFDVLWPELSVSEHLTLHASLKGYTGAALRQVVQESVDSVGLAGKEDCLASDLSGGQRRKLSLAGALVGQPSVVMVDEPTSGMDPYTRRFTWDLLRAQRASNGSAILLTTHSMEEAEALADYVVIMARGRVVAEGTPQQLKTQFGEGYTLTLVFPATSQHAATSQQPDLTAQDAQLVELVQAHVVGAALIGRQGEQVAFRLPRAETGSFPALLRELDRRVAASKAGPTEPAAQSSPSVTGYGMNVTTLEEVFLRVTEGAGSVASAHIPAASQPAPVIENNQRDASAREHYTKVKGWRLLRQQLYGLLVKRALCASRERLTLMVQMLVPLALVALSLWVSSIAIRNPNAAPLACDRSKVLMDQPTVMAADASVRQAEAGRLWSQWLDSYSQVGTYKDSNTSHIWSLEPANGTLDDYLLSNWNNGHPAYDALFVKSLPSPQAWLQDTPDSPFRSTILLNQSAIHGITASLSQLSSAAMRYMEHAVNMPTTQQQATQPVFKISNEPLPTLDVEKHAMVKQDIAGLLVVLCITLATSLMAAMPAVHLVRERASQALHVQYVSGARPLLVWLANLMWDMLQFAVTSTGIIALIVLIDVPQYMDERLKVFSGLLLVFGPAALSLTYLLQHLFKDEMHAVQHLSTLYFVAGFLAFMTTWIIDLVLMLTSAPALENLNYFIQDVAGATSPHYIFARAIYDLWLLETDPFAWSIWGGPLLTMACQAAVYLTATILLDSGVLLAVRGWLHKLVKFNVQWWARLKPRAMGYSKRRKVATLEPAEQHSQTITMSMLDSMPKDEDEDVAAERVAVQGGTKHAESQVLLDGVTKRYHSGPLAALLGAHDRRAVHAVKGLWLGIPRGQCFGLLGVNGAGKTSTFNMLTGQLQPDSGDAYVCSYSVTSHLTAARHRLGYCPQFESLLGAMTPLEVLNFYARLRGVPCDAVRPTVRSLLERLGLAAAAHQPCGTLSGGNKRKLALGVALVGEPPVALLDEPTTGVDPGARRAMWTLLKSEAMSEGRSVVLTSHSMEECEALCDRVAIMVAGSAACLGSCQHLKARFGGGYILHMQVASNDVIPDLVASLQGPAPGAVLAEVHDASMEVHIPRGAAKLAELFEWLEAHKVPTPSVYHRLTTGTVGTGTSTLGNARLQQITSYALSLASLQSVFIRLAQPVSKAHL